MVNITDYDIEVLNNHTEPCKGCLNWKDFKEGCWYHWENKRHCSQKIKI